MCNGVTVPFVPFPSPVWFLCLLPILFQQWIYELPHSPVQLMTRPARINEVPVWAKTQKATECKGSETKMVPLQEPFAAQLPREGLLSAAIPTESPHSRGRGRRFEMWLWTPTHCYQSHVSLAPGYIATCSSVEMTGITWLKSVLIWKRYHFCFLPSPTLNSPYHGYSFAILITAISQVSRRPKVNLLDWCLCNQDCQN